MPAERRAGELRVGVVGAGGRSAVHLSHIPGDVGPVRFVALADPDEGRCAAFEGLFAGKFGGERPRRYEDAPSMIAAEDLDALVVGSPNAFHARDASAAMSAGLTTMLEKPVGISVDGCRDLWRAGRDGGDRRLFVGFVLRYTPFYSRVKEIVDSGELGQLLAIDADESLGTALTMTMHRGWRADDTLSGGFLVEKCCHDFDILNWLVGAAPARVFSMAARSHFVGRPAAERHRRFDPLAAPLDDDGVSDQDRRHREAFFRPDATSPYESGAALPDHQTVLLDYPGGVLCSLTASMAQPRSTRRLRIFGSNGALEGDIGNCRIVVQTSGTVRQKSWTTREISLDDAVGGHHGGDRVLAGDFWQAAAGRPAPPRAGLRDGVEAVLVALAAQESSASGEAIETEAMRKAAFDA